MHTHGPNLKKQGYSSVVSLLISFTWLCRQVIQLNTELNRWDKNLTWTWSNDTVLTFSTDLDQMYQTPNVLLCLYKMKTFICNEILSDSCIFDSWSLFYCVLKLSEFSRPVSAMCENHDGLSHRSISEQRRLHSPSVDEQETELEPSLEQDEDEGEQEQEQDQNLEQDKDYDGNVTPSRKKEIMVIKISVLAFPSCERWRSHVSSHGSCCGPGSRWWYWLQGCWCVEV